MGAVFNAVFPDDCRVCGAALGTISRIPVCPACLSSFEPLAAEYHCAGCHAPFRNAYALDESGRCALCRLGARGFDAAYTPFTYEDKLARLIQLFKYQGIRSLAQPLGARLSAALPRWEAPEVVVAMPMPWWRQVVRGYNQAALLAREVARHTGLPLAAPLRRRWSEPQAGRSGAQRRANVRGKFRVTKPAAVRGRHVLLVDDVLTTGATASACAGALKRAGAARVTLLALARVDRRILDFELAIPTSQTLSQGDPSA
jgi:ComF family protein